MPGEIKAGYITGQTTCPAIVSVYLPSPHSFVAWWLWLQNFYRAVGGGGNNNIDEYLMYFRIDAEMKIKMGY